MLPPCFKSLTRSPWRALALIVALVCAGPVAQAQSADPCADLNSNPVGALFGAALGCRQSPAAVPGASRSPQLEPQASPYAEQALITFRTALENDNGSTGTYGHAIAKACQEDKPGLSRAQCEQLVHAHRVQITAEVDAVKKDAGVRAKAQRAAERQALFANPLPGTMKDGLPCLSGICLGDDVRALGPIKWEEMRLTKNQVPPRAQKLTPLELDRAKSAIAPQPEATVRAIGPYLLAGAFDAYAIEQLKKVPAVCWHTNLDGIFFSESGYQTFVRITPRAVDARTQVLEVTLIKRVFTGVDTSSQQEALSADLEKRYGAFARSRDDRRLASYTMTDAEIAREKSYWHFNTSYTPELVLAMNRPEYDEASERKLRELPGCELKRPSID
jgi:hypothetical protein